MNDIEIMRDSVDKAEERVSELQEEYRRLPSKIAATKNNEERRRLLGRLDGDLGIELFEARLAEYEARIALEEAEGKEAEIRLPDLVVACREAASALETAQKALHQAQSDESRARYRARESRFALAELRAERDRLIKDRILPGPVVRTRQPVVPG